MSFTREPPSSLVSQPVPSLDDMTTYHGSFFLPSGVRVGQIRGRHDRPAKNARWYLARSVRPAQEGRPGEPALLAKVGWGDLSYVDLQRLAGHLAADEAFIVLPETPPGGQHLPWHAPGAGDPPGSWCWYDRPDDDPGPSLAALVDGAWYAIVDGTLVVVDRYAEANRLGGIWRERGYRYTGTGRRVSTGRVRLKAISAESLMRRLEQIVGDAATHAVDLPARPATGPEE